MRVSWELENDGCGSEFIVGSFEIVLKIAFVCVLMSNFGVDFAQYIIFSNISVNFESTCIHLISKCV